MFDPAVCTTIPGGKGGILSLRPGPAQNAPPHPGCRFIKPWKI